jgi:hypothetical protein
VGEVDLHYIHDWRSWRIESGPTFEAKFGRKVVLLVGDEPFYNKYF